MNTHIYVFLRNSTTWSQQDKLTASDAAPNEIFGYSVAISGDTAIVGAPGDDDGGISSGSAYVFRFIEPSSQPSSLPSNGPSTEPPPVPSDAPSGSPSTSPSKFCRKNTSGLYPTGSLLILRKGDSNHKNNKAGDDETDEAGIIVEDTNKNNNSNSGSSVLDPVSCYNFLVKNLPHNKYGALKTRCDQEGIYDLGRFDTGKKVRDICVCECEDF